MFESPATEEVECIHMLNLVLPNSAVKYLRASSSFKRIPILGLIPHSEALTSKFLPSEDAMVENLRIVPIIFFDFDL